MNDYRQEGTGKVMTEEKLRNLAKNTVYTFEEYIEKAKFTIITSDAGKPDFQQGSATGANVLPKEKEAQTNMVLNSENTSSDLPEADPTAFLKENIFEGTTPDLQETKTEPELNPKSKYFVTAEDLKKGSEEDLAPYLNKRLSRLGLTVEQSTALGSLDAVSLSRVDKADPELGVLVDLLSAIKVGENQSEKDLEESAAAINSYIEKNGNLDFLNTSNEVESSTYENYVEQIQAPSLSKKEINSNVKSERLEKFLKQDSKTSTMSYSEYRESGLMKPEEAKYYKGGGVKKVKAQATKEDFASAEEFKAYKDWQKDGFVKDVSDNEIAFYDNERKKKYALEKSSEYVSDLSPVQRTAILALASEDEEKILNFKENAKSYFNTREELGVALDNYGKNKTQENYLQAFELQSSYLKQQNDLQEDQAKLEASGAADREKAVPYAIDDFNRNFDRVAQLVTATKSMGTDVMYSMAQLALLRDPNALAKMAGGVKLSTQVEQNFGLVSLGGNMQKEMENFQRAIAVDEIGSIKDAGRWVAGSIPNLLPSLGMALTGPLAMPLFGLSGAGGSGMAMAIKQKDAASRMVSNIKLLDEKPDMDQLDRDAIETQMNKDSEILKIPDWKILSNQVVAGIAEVAFERIGTMSLLNGLKNGVKMLPPQTVKEGFEFVAKTLEKGFRVEGGSELGTTLVTNFGDIHILGEDKNYFEGGLEALAQGSLMGGGIGAVTAFKGVKQAVISELANKAEVESLFSITKKLRELTNMKIQGPSDPALNDLGYVLAPEILKTIDDLKAKGRALEDGVLFKIGDDLSPEALKKVGEVNKKIRRINQRLIDAYANPNIKAGQLASIEKVLRGEFNELAGEREKILTNETDIKAAKKSAAEQKVSMDSSFGYQLYREKMLAESNQYVKNSFNDLSPQAKQAEIDEAIELLKENPKEGTKEPTTKEIKQKALDNYVAKTYKTRIKSGQANAEKFAKDMGLNVEFVVAETNEEAIEALKNISPDTLNESQYTNDKGEVVTTEMAFKENKLEGLIVPNSNKIIISLESSVANKRTGVFAHEVLHAYAKQFYGKGQKEIDAAGKSLLTYLEKSQPDLYAKVKFRIDESYASKDINDEITDKTEFYYEEAMNAMSDVLADGQKVTESTIDRIRIFANKFLPSKVQLKNGEEAYHFVKDYNKASHFGGKITQDPIIKRASNDEDKSNPKSKASITKLNAQLEELTEDYYQDEIDFDVYEQQKANLENKIKAAEKEATVISKDPKDEIEVFHGGSINSTKDIEGFAYFSENKEQAARYAKGNEGSVSKFVLNKKDIQNEEVVLSEIEKLGLKPNGGFEASELNLYEMIDPSFETSLSQSDLNKLAESLKAKGVKAVRFLDMNLKTLKNDIENIVVLDKTIINQSAKPVAKPKPKSIKKDSSELKEVTAKSKKELDDIGNNPDGFNKNNPRIYAILKGMIKSKSLAFKTKKGNIVNLNSLPGFNIDNMVSETMLSLLPYIAKFNPKQNNSFFGYLMANVSNRMKGALNTGRVTDSAFDEDVSEAKGVTASETTFDEIVEEKAKYKNLIQQKVLGVDGLKQVKEKVISTVRVLKKRIDAVIGKNASVTPIVAEIRKAIGKQADIVFKKEMGGVKNGELERYLKANKKAILENMTTTYLLTFMPEGVQKSVGGKYMLNAKGEKTINSFGDNTFIPKFVNSDVWKNSDNIDGEKTSTGAKGKTSGADIQRRLPNIAQEIEDDFFVSKIIDSNGKPIPGRKESLAKAMGEEIGFDMISQDLKTNGPITEALKNNQEALGVVITEQFEDILDGYMQRGDVKYSVTKKQLFNAMDIMRDNNYDQESSSFKEWLDNPIHKDAVKIWDESLGRLFTKTDGAVRTQYTKDAEKMIAKFPYFEEAIESYGAGFLNNPDGDKSKIAIDQLQGFWESLSESIDPVISSVKGLNFLGSATRTSTPSEKITANLKSKAKHSPEAQKAFDVLKDKLKNVVVYSGNSSDMNAIREFMLNTNESADGLVEAFVNDKISNKITLAKEANILLFNYLNILAKEVVVNQTSKKSANEAFAGYLRWLETNNNNDSGLKGLAHVVGFEILEDQAVYKDPKGRGYYSVTSDMTVVEGETAGKGQLVINKKHTNWKAAETAIQKINNSKKEKEKNRLNNLEQFIKDQNVASSLQIMGEHQQSMGQTGIELAGAVAKNAISILEKNQSKEVANDIFNLELSRIASGFGIVLNSRFISEAQDKLFGKTSPLKKSRVEAVGKEINNSIFALNGELISEQGKEEMAQIVEDLIRTKELSESNNANQKAKKEKSRASLSKKFNKIIERNKGIAAETTYSRVMARKLGAKIGRFQYYLPKTAEDFRLLVGYTFSGKGKQGTEDMAWFEKTLIRPYTEGVNAMDVAKRTALLDFQKLNKAMPIIRKSLKKEIPSNGYTNDQAIRVYLWKKAGFEIPGLSESEVNDLVSYVTGNPELAIYANSLLTISKSDKWIKPSEYWDAGSILEDVRNLTEKSGRKAYLAEWIENVEEIFGKLSAGGKLQGDNANKIEAIYGKRHRDALEDSIYRMINGRNRPSGTNAQVNKWNNWLNNSVGSIMFFNRRSALLQLLSVGNFLNWSDNNPAKAAATFANQEQYWKDWWFIINSPKLRLRRTELKNDINSSELYSAVDGATNKAEAALSYLLKIGFLPTQAADGLAIAGGGASFYRNRINTYLKKVDADGNKMYTEKQAEDKAFIDFSEISDQSQQSSDPSLVSSEQASILGRLVLAFQNTTQQYGRIMKRSALDIIKRRQMPGTSSMLQSDFSNFSKIVYFGAIQNLIFNSLSAAIFALIPGFDTEDDEEVVALSQDKKLSKILQGSIDSLLRGTGVKGAVVAQIKNTIMEYFKQKERGFKGDQAYTIIQMANISPPVGSKIGKVYAAIKGEKYGIGVMEERGFDLTANGRLNLSPTYQVLGSLAAGTANIPLDRMYAEVQNVAEMFDDRNTTSQRVMMALGFRSWDVNAKNEEDDLIKMQLKETKKVDNKQKAKEKRTLSLENKIKRRKDAYETLTNAEKFSLAGISKTKRKKFLDNLAKRLEE